MYYSEDLKTFIIKKAYLALQIPKAKEVLLSTSSTGKLAKYQLYLRRILNLTNSNEEIYFKECLAKYELCVVAPSISNNNGFLRTP